MQTLASNNGSAAGPPPDVALLETHRLSKNFGGVHAVTEVDFRLQRGELRCLIGPNGAGKSTFFKMLSGQLRATEGTIVFDGNDITGVSQHRIARLGMGIKNQVPSVWDGLSVYEHFWIAAQRRVGAGAARAVAADLLTELSLEPVAHREVGALAHGERQWVEIGMVVAQQPTLILLDEPTAGMGADEVERTVGLLRTVNVKASLIVVEHDMQFIRMIGGIVTVLHQGRILIEDAMENVLASRAVREVYLGSGHARG